MANNHRNGVGERVTIIDEKPAAKPKLHDGLLSSPGKIGGTLSQCLPRCYAAN